MRALPAAIMAAASSMRGVQLQLAGGRAPEPPQPPQPARRYGHNHAAVGREPAGVAAHFGDVEGVRLRSPAFDDPAGVPRDFALGTQGPTPDAVVDSFLGALARRNAWMDYATADFVSEEGRPVPYVRLSSGSGSAAKVRVWLQGGVHGNEPAGDQALLALLGALDANQTWAAALLARLDVLVLPRYNPDGVFYFQRALATNYDANRDHGRLARRHTRNVRALFRRFDPHVAADFHEYTAVRQFGRFTHAADGFLAAAKNLNIHAGIRALAEDVLVPRMGAALEAHGLRWEPYVTGPSSNRSDFQPVLSEAGTDANTGRNAMGLAQCVALLVETRGIRIASRHFQRRTAAGLVMASALLQTAADPAARVLDTVEASVRAFVDGRDDIVVTDRPRETRRRFTMVDRANGSVVQVPVRFFSTTPVAAGLTRRRPEAYLVPRAWADVAQRLAAAGVDVQTLEAPWNGTVEALRIVGAVREGGDFEGVVPMAVTAEVATRELSLPAGSFRVSTRQKRAALAFVALEPESPSSYARLGMVPVRKGDEYPIFREPGAGAAGGGATGDGDGDGGRGQ